MEELFEGEFELDGYRFGTPDSDVVILEGGLDTGAPSIAVNDIDNPVGDGGHFGRDFLRGPTWAFTLGVRDDENVDRTLAELARVWRNEAVRTTPGAVSTLRFKRNGIAYRVYGRPRRFGVAPAEVADPGWQIVEADFRVAEPLMYRDEAEEVTITLDAPPEEEDEGVILPEVLEWYLGRDSASKTVILAVQTLDPAPFEVYIEGPQTGGLSNFKLEGPGWEIDFGVTVVSPGSTLHVDTRAATALLDGKSVANSTMSRRTRLNARLLNGASSVTFTGADPSGTAKARIVWRATSPIL